MKPSAETLPPSEYRALLRSDLVSFAQCCFRELNPRTRFAMNWHIEIIAAKLAALRDGRIRRLIVNLPQNIDLMKFIFHPTRRRRPLAPLDGSRVE